MRKFVYKKIKRKKKMMENIYILKEFKKKSYKILFVNFQMRILEIKLKISAKFHLKFNKIILKRIVFEKCKI